MTIRHYRLQSYLGAPILILILCAGLTLPVQAGIPEEKQIKAVLLYNFARYTTWPDAALDTDTFRICIFGRSPFAESLQLTVANETIKGRPLLLVYPRQLEALPACHIVFAGLSETYGEYEILSRIAGFPVLTVGDSADFIGNGGMVNFDRQDNKIRFTVNPDAVAAAGLKISANLLHIARIVRQPPLSAWHAP